MKMYHQTDTLSADGTSSLTKRKQGESHNRRRKHRKGTHHSRNSKQPPRRSRSDGNKSDTKVKNCHLKNYDSEYIGPNRLTKHMGFLAKGKISDSISRLEDLLPENIRARSKQDLRRIIELNASPKSNGTGSGSNISYSRQHKDISSDEQSNFEPVSSRSPEKHLPNSDLNEKCKEKSGKLSVTKRQRALVSSVESRKSSNKNTPQQSRDEISICREIITKKLHSTVASTNSLLFPNSSIQTNLLKELMYIKAKYQASQTVVSKSSNCESSQDDPSCILRQELMDIKTKYQTSQKVVSNSSNCESSQDNPNCILRQELMDIKTKYQASQKVVSNSSNCESSQDNINPSCIEDSPASNFKLNPVLTQENLPAPKKMENLFPVRQDYSSSSESEDEIYIDAQALLSRQAVVKKTVPKESKAESCSSGRDSSVILIPSSQSSNGSPVWISKNSPVKFVPEFIPTPKLYFRQKMF